jgi:HNH endonuclease
MLFIENKYTIWYFNIIEKASSRILPKTEYIERHHIIPKSMGGTDTKDNLVKLTAKEHYICHRLLTRMTEGENKSKMCLAVYMLNISSKNQNRHKINGNVYEKLKTAWIAAKKGRPSPRRGIKQTNPKILQNIRDAAAIRENKYKTGELYKKQQGKYTRSAAHRKILSDKIKDNPLMSTNKQSIEARERARINISKSRKGQPAKNKGIIPSKISCLICHCETDVRNFARWHGSNCRKNYS